MTIRLATEEDIPRLVAMGRKFHEAKQSDYDFVEQDTAQFFANVIAGGVVFVCKNGFIAGVISGAPSNSHFRTAYEVFWWSEGKSGLKLKRAFEGWAADNGCQEIKFSHPVGEDRVSAILERSGYEPSEQVHRRLT